MRNISDPILKLTRCPDIWVMTDPNPPLPWVALEQEPELWADHKIHINPLSRARHSPWFSYLSLAPKPLAPDLFAHPRILIALITYKVWRGEGWGWKAQQSVVLLLHEATLFKLPFITYKLDLASCFGMSVLSSTGELFSHIALPQNT